MRRIGSLSIIAIVILSTSSALSQQPSIPSVEKSISNEQPERPQKTENNPRPQQTLPGKPSPIHNAISDNLKIEPANDEPKSNRQQNDWREEWIWKFFLDFRITDALLALFTGFLVVIGAKQATRLRQTVESYMTGERSYIFPSVPDFTAFFPSGAHAMYPTMPGVPVPKVGLKFANVGRTSCIIKAIRTEISIGDDLPGIPKFIYSAELIGDIVSRPDMQTETITFEFNRNLTVDEINYIGVGTTPVYIFGYVRYADIFGFLITKGYCFQVRRGPNGFIRIAGGGAYNYRKYKKATPNEAL